MSRIETPAEDTKSTEARSPMKSGTRFAASAAVAAMLVAGVVDAQIIAFSGAAA